MDDGERLLLVREIDERLGLTGLIQNYLVDSRTGRNTQFPLVDLFRQSAYSRLAGYEDLNDATQLASDPTFRLREGLGAGCSSDLHLALVRDGLVGARGESDRCRARGKE